MALAGGDVEAHDIQKSLEALKFQEGPMKVFPSPPGTIAVPNVLHFFKAMEVGQCPVAHFWDVVEKWEGKIDLEKAKTLLEREKPLYQDLEEPLRPKAVMPKGMQMQLSVIPLAADSFCILK